MQLTLFNQTDKWADKADLWMETNPQAVNIFCEYALHQSSNGTKKIGAKDVAEQMRWHGNLMKDSDPFKVNNNYVKYLAQKAARRYPQLQGAFRFRGQRTA